MKVLNFDIVSFLVSSLSTPFLIQGHGKLLPCVLFSKTSEVHTVLVFLNYLRGCRRLQISVGHNVSDD